MEQFGQQEPEKKLTWKKIFLVAFLLRTCGLAAITEGMVLLIDNNIIATTKENTNFLVPLMICLILGTAISFLHSLWLILAKLTGFYE